MTFVSLFCLSLRSVQRRQFQQSEDRVREHEEAKLRLQREVEAIREREARFAEERNKLAAATVAGSPSGSGK